ncbi:nucleoside triphosphate pyrophosphohydrolase family protein [Actinobacillus equuli subsp. haemolyticus]|uniref:Nucleoside triphosphate pyrophosphohydrolase family protein n=1 Tax=Actinobacillus equuli subsp. equuli TaxID=202947 RepID=A0A9X4JCA6_ACTEU|nr:nucleoside triphosphate pyrophosphohydrolase family protein [Actinobacillus equuli]MDE8034617.1 nucleoside triphosphate pyrophosphohydrolase family protein [Actinobacillus equuli subsp. equuli]MDG4948747.1 nucleoside triphosphate pyrophosphohydrolase family protein [Actinobacillus equuli subsp. haemolyticus]WGE63762.1 nucleoside triphosphate pyrophosphohydrolase family protein [Actinobacillus equuli subsp. haemolyticus]
MKQMKQNTINLNQIANWFKMAVPNPTDDNKRVQISCHLEEVCEMLMSLGGFSEGDELYFLSEKMKNRTSYNDVISGMSNFDKIELLDALCDQIVTAIGVAHMFGMDIQGALQEVANSNDSKFEDGKPVFNEHGKIAKGKHYLKPNLEPFV